MLIGECNFNAIALGDAAILTADVMHPDTSIVVTPQKRVE